jgi:hypothetical protein
MVKRGVDAMSNLCKRRQVNRREGGVCGVVGWMCAVLKENVVVGDVLYLL